MSTNTFQSRKASIINSYCRYNNSQRTKSNGRKAVSNGAWYGHNQQMVSTASPPQGNCKTEVVKSVTIHGGKCLTVPANANETHVRSKSEQGWVGRNGVQFKNDRVTNSLSVGHFSGLWTTVTNEPRSEMPVTFRSQLCLSPLRLTPNAFHQRPG